MEPSHQEVGPVPSPAMPEQLQPAINSSEKPAAADAEHAPAAPEIAPISPSAPSVQASNPAPAIPMPFPPSAPISQPVDDVTAATSAAAIPVIDDGDLIEKEWVNKAKQIVERNRDDPYKQTEELTIFKAEYMKKRYGKSIKLSK